MASDLKIQQLRDEIDKFESVDEEKLMRRSLGEESLENH